MSSIMSEPTHDSIATRETLLNRLKDCDDHASWQEFYDTYRNLIYEFALKAGLTESEAEDVVQETVIGVARKLPEFSYDPARCSFKTWLLNLTTWRVKDRFRRRVPAKRTTIASADETARTATVERVPDPAGEQWKAMWEEDWKKTILQAALRRIKGEANLKDCQMFELYVLRQLPAREVARSLRVSVARVYLAKHRIAPLVKKQIAHLESQKI
jgi:RNA polymerase sigma-70 factor (ECF subfamily)